MRKLANTISSFNRVRKFNYFLEKFKPKPTDSILDVGFADVEYSNVDNYLEKNYPYKSQITALGISGSEHFSKLYPDVKIILYDGKHFPFEDKSFDIGWSNAVIEHVGNQDAQLLFLQELLRTCKQFIFTTPNRYFPIEFHTRIPILHWLPKSVFDSVLLHTKFKYAAGDYMNLLTIRQIKSLLKKAGVTNYSIKKNRFCGFVMDYCITFDSFYPKSSQ